MSKLHRLSIFNIADPMTRGRLIAEIKRPASDWRRWEVRLDESMRPDLIAFRYYQTTSTVPVVLAAAGVNNPDNPIQVGKQIQLPPASWLRERIRFYQDESERLIARQRAE